MEPISLIATALALGAAAGLKSTAEQAVKDAYGGLKKLIQDRYSSAEVSLAQLEKAPASAARRGVVEEDLTDLGAEKDEDVLRRAKEVLDTVRKYAPEAGPSIGVSLEDVRAASLSIEGIIASGTGVSVRKGDFAGDIEIRDVKAGTRDAQDPKG